MSTETDFRNMIAVFDHALTSEDLQVKQALNTLVMMVALTRDPDGDTDGPFKHMWHSFEDSRKEVRELKRAVDSLMQEVEMLKVHQMDPTQDSNFKRWNQLRGTSVDQIWIDEVSTAPGSAWESFIKKKVTK